MERVLGTGSGGCSGTPGVFLADLVAGAAVCAYLWAVAGAERVDPRPAAVR